MSVKETPNLEKRLAAVAMVVVPAACVGLLLGLGFLTGEDPGLADTGSTRSEWLDVRTVPVRAEHALHTAARVPAPGRPVTVSSRGMRAPEPSGRQDARVRREDLGFEVPATTAVFDEIPLRRTLGELEGMEDAVRARSARIARACEGRCEEGLADLDAASAYGRESAAEHRARLVARGENVARVSRDLEFLEP